MEDDKNQNPNPNGEGDNGNENEPANLEGVVKELKDLRQKNTFLAETVTGLNKKVEEYEKTAKPVDETPKQLTEEEKLEEIAKKVLAQQEASRAKADKQAAIDRFVAENKEYHSDNDPTGLKKKAFLDKLSLFNLDNLSGEQFVSAIRDAHRLAGGSDSSAQNLREVQNPYSFTPTNGTHIPPKKDDGFTDEERKVLERTGISPEKFKAMKEKNPDFINSLFNR